MNPTNLTRIFDPEIQSNQYYIIALNSNFKTFWGQPDPNWPEFGPWGPNPIRPEILVNPAGLARM